MDGSFRASGRLRGSPQLSNLLRRFSLTSSCVPRYHRQGHSLLGLQVPFSSKAAGNSLAASLVATRCTRACTHSDPHAPVNLAHTYAVPLCISKLCFNFLSVRILGSGATGMCLHSLRVTSSGNPCGVILQQRIDCVDSHSSPHLCSVALSCALLHPCLASLLTQGFNALGLAVMTPSAALASSMLGMSSVGASISMLCTAIAGPAVTLCAHTHY